MAASGKQAPKAMSSRLAGMKFMQRGSPSTPNTPSGPPAAKRQRLSNGTGAGTYTPTASPHDEATNDAIGRAAAEKGDTKWYLSYKTPNMPAAQSPLRIVSAGYAALDAQSSRNHDAKDEDDEEEDGEEAQVPGRINYGNFRRTSQKQRSKPEESESSSNSDEDEIDDNDPVNALIKQGRKEATARAKAELRAKKEENNYESQRLAQERRKREVNLNSITSISGGGNAGGSGGGGGYMANMICHSCEGKGHKAADCPKKRINRGTSKLRRS